MLPGVGRQTDKTGLHETFLLEKHSRTAVAWRIK